MSRASQCQNASCEQPHDVPKRETRFSLQKRETRVQHVAAPERVQHVV